jgi:hypothetical protein
VGEGQDTTQDKVTIQEAARRLGVKEDAVRKRIQRRSIRHEKAEDGRVYVWVDAAQDTTRDTGQTTQDTYQDTAQDERVEDLREQVGYLRRQLDEEREARRRADTIIAQLARTTEEQARTIRELEAPSELPSEAQESPQTAEEESERAESQPNAEDAQESTESPRQWTGWLAPVDKLPWWHYVLGLFLVFSGGFLAFTTELFPKPTYAYPPDFLVIPTLLAIAWSPAGIFGFWVGYRKRNLRLWSQVLPLGALVGGVAFIGVERGRLGSFPFVSFAYLDTRILAIVFFPALLLFVSASLLGNALQRRRTGRISGTTPASPVSRATQGAAQQPRKDLTPTQQAMLGWGGTIISALITLVGTIITLRSGQ